MVGMITTLLTLRLAGKGVVLLTPWPSKSDDTLMTSKIIDDDAKKRLKSVRYVVPPWNEDATYEIITNSASFDDEASLEEAMLNFFSGAVATFNFDSIIKPILPVWRGGASFALPSGDGAREAPARRFVACAVEYDFTS